MTRADVTKLHADTSKRGLVRANRALAALRHMLNLAINEWGCVRAPTRPVACGAIPNIRGIVILSRMSWDGCWWRSALPGQGAANIIRLALLTGARRGELLGATWDQFNLAAGVWSKPASLTKQARLRTIP